MEVELFPRGKRYEHTSQSEESPTLQTKTMLKDTNSKRNMKGKSKPLYFWNSGDVNKWMKKHTGQCYNLYGDLFMENDVTGRTLIRLNEIKLERMGIYTPEHKKLLMHQVLKLRLKHEGVELKTLDQKGTGSFELSIPSRVPESKSS